MQLFIAIKTLWDINLLDPLVLHMYYFHFILNKFSTMLLNFFIVLFVVLDLFN
jgi:hypothetical protein